MAALLCVPSSGTLIGEDQLLSVDPTDAPTADPTPTPTPDPTPKPTVAPTATPAASPIATPGASPAVSSATSPAGPEATEAANCMAVGKAVDEKRAKEREANVAEAEAIGKKKLEIVEKDDASKTAAEGLLADKKKERRS